MKAFAGITEHEANWHRCGVSARLCLSVERRRMTSIFFSEAWRRYRLALVGCLSRIELALPTSALVALGSSVLHIFCCLRGTSQLRDHFIQVLVQATALFDNGVRACHKVV